MEGIPALALWELIIDVFHPTKLHERERVKPPLMIERLIPLINLLICTKNCPVSTMFLQIYQDQAVERYLYF